MTGRGQESPGNGPHGRLVVNHQNSGHVVVSPVVRQTLRARRRHAARDMLVFSAGHSHTSSLRKGWEQETAAGYRNRLITSPGPDGSAPRTTDRQPGAAETGAPKGLLAAARRRGDWQRGGRPL